MKTIQTEPTESETPEANVGSELLRLLDGLPPPKQVELLDFARFLRQQAMGEIGPELQSRVVREVSAESLASLTAVVALGGDAVTDTEAFYDSA